MKYGELIAGIALGSLLTLGLMVAYELKVYSNKNKKYA